MSGERNNGHGPTAREIEILDMRDGGMGADAIAAELGVTPGYVRSVLSRLNGGWAMNNAFDAMVRRGSIALAAACDRAGGRFT